jgi:hypothetical protein
MKLKKALKIINSFKNSGLKETLKDIEKSEKTILISDFENVFSSAKIIKAASAQIDDIVHVSGIMLAKSIWLQENEKVEYVSLGAGNHIDRSDLETNLRIAEFKFGKWNENSANGIRRRGYFSNYINLLTANINQDKYFVVEDKTAFVKFMNGKAKWKNVLSKNPTAFKKLENFLVDNSMESLETVNEIYNHFKEVVTVINFNKIITNTNS